MITKEEFEKKIKILINKLQVGLYDQVLIDAQKLQKVRNDQILINIISLAHQYNGNYDSSIKILDKGLKSNPNNIFFLNNMGLSYFKKNDIKNAENFFNRALEIDPTYINVLNNYGNLKKELDLFDEAIEFFSKALLSDENSLETNYNLATSYQGLGDYINAIKFFEKVLKINPNFTKADRNISSIVNYTKESKHFLSMKKKVTKKDLKIDQKLELHFALGKAYEDIKDYKEAFKNISNANLLMKKVTNYDISTDQKQFDEIKKFFDNKKYLATKKNKIKTIFILGMPRSGTSITEQIISSHPEVFGGGELIYLNKIINEKIINNPSFFNKTNQIFSEAQDDYLSKISFKNKNFLNFTDKAPLNFKWIGFILNILPNSKIIHCKRDKADVCWSNYKNQFEGSLHFSNDLKDLSNYYKMYEELMNFWKEKFDNQIYDLNHEKLISEPEKTIKELINFCELEWDEKCLKPEANKRAIKTISFKQARTPIYKNKVKNLMFYYEYLGDLKKFLSS
jgi:tetratricopeptide (TPR) repeat protein